jgi:DNA-binding transcriptional LysR family regulator
MTAGRVRFGYHGSLPAAQTIVRAAGHRVERFSFAEYDITDPFRALRGGDLDLMIVKFGRTEPDLAYSATVATDQRVAVLGAHHPLAGRTSVSVEELADFDAFRCPGRFPPSVWDEVVPPRTPAGRPIRRRHELTGADTMMTTVERTDAVHISIRSLADIARPTVRVVPVHDLPPAAVRLAWLPDHEPAQVRGFVRAAEAAAVRGPTSSVLLASEEPT